MNINQWIDDLGQANPLSESPAYTNQPRTTHKHGRGSGASSLLEPFVDRIRHTDQTQLAESPCAPSSATSHVTHTSSSSSSSTPSSFSSKKYQRRPRHHTKADKYHPKLDQRLQAKEKKKKGGKKNKKKVKRSHRKKHKSEAITGLVQSFHAKHVPRDRLTVISTMIAIFKPVAKDRHHSSILAPKLDCTQKVAHQGLQGAKAVS